jgi:hypothetical protein
MEASAVRRSATVDAKLPKQQLDEHLAAIGDIAEQDTSASSSRSHSPAASDAVQMASPKRRKTKEDRIESSSAMVKEGLTTLAKSLEPAKASADIQTKQLELENRRLALEEKQLEAREEERKATLKLEQDRLDFEREKYRADQARYQADQERRTRLDEQLLQALVKKL